ncbi:MAG: hypothetical protein WCL50_08290, partial [Spirochaetota bacterium]
MKVGLAIEGLYLETVELGITKRFLAGKSLDKGTHDIMVSFRPIGDGYSAVWTIDGQRFGPMMVGALAPSFDEFSLGGPGSLTAIFDCFALSLDGDLRGPPALFASSLHRLYSDTFIAAAGFEGGLSDEFVLRGRASPATFAYSLDSGSAVALAAPISTVKPIGFESTSRGGHFHLQVEDRDGTILFSIADDGKVVDALGESLGEVKERQGR